MKAALRTLIVEDVPSDAKLIVHQLRRDWPVVDWLRVDSEPAYREALRQPLDVILSDCNLPGFSGARALELLRETGLDVPLIIVSGTIGEEAAAELIRQGAADYVSKDRPTRLGMAVSRAIAEAQLRRDRERAVDDLRRSEARLRALFESNVIGIVVAKPSGQILEANGYFLSMLGRSRTELPLDWVAITPKKFLAADREVLQELELHGRASPWEKEFLDSSGNRIPVLMGSAKLPDNSLVCFVVDLTQIKTVQANLELAKSQLEDAIKQLKQTQQAVIAKERLHALGKMASGIAHDFNNNLSPIVGLSDLILTRPGLIDDHEKVLKFVGTIRQAGQDAALVVSRLRDFYRSAGDDNETQVVDLKQVVQSAIELTRPRWADQAMAAGTKYEITTTLADLSVMGHASELREMLINLIFNALDAMPNGGGLSVTVDSTAGRLARLEVTDTGVGMSAEVRKRCMEPFFTTKGAAGTGLGLASCFGIVKRHHGQILIESELGHGTRVIVTLPKVSSRGVLPEPRQDRRIPPMHILVIDDDEAVRYVIAEYLRGDGHIVDLADGPGAGLSKIKAGPYDLIITDRAMPEMSGDGLALEAKRVAPHVPILMLSGFGEFMIAAGERPEGVDLVLTKPVTINALSEAIALVLVPRLQVPEGV